MPVIGVNKDGVVGIVWYDRRDNPEGLGWYVRFSASLDGGDTWLPSVRVSDSPASFQGPDRFALRPSSGGGGTVVWSDGKINPPPPPRSGGNPISVSMGANDFSITGGHYSGLAVDAAGIFRPMWVDNRTGVAQLWTAGVTVKATGVKNGSADLANLEDVSEKVALDLTEASFDRGASTVTWTARLKNTSKDTIRGPVKGRVIELKSSIGVPKVASDGGRAEGTVLDFTPLLKNNVLLPGDSTATRKIVVKLNDLRPLATNREMKYSLVSMSIRVLAPEVKKPAAPAEEKK
jgi:hypothetical protein